MLSQSDLETNLARIHEWIRGADDKVSIFLAFQGIVLAILFPKSYQWVVGNFANFNALEYLLIFIGVGLIGISIFKSTAAIIPRLKNHTGKKSVTYFRDIAQTSLDDFKAAIHAMDENEFKNELVSQTHISAIIASRKYLQFRHAILTFFVGVILLAISFLIFRI